MTSPTCVDGVPRGPFNTSSTQPHCVIPAFENSTTVLSNCINKQGPENTRSSIVPFTTKDTPACDYVYANISQEISIEDVMLCLIDENKFVVAGCYGRTDADKNRSAADAKDKEGSVGRVEGKMGLLLGVLMIVGVFLGGDLGL